MSKIPDAAVVASRLARIDQGLEYCLSTKMMIDEQIKRLQELARKNSDAERDLQREKAELLAHQRE